MPTASGCRKESTSSGILFCLGNDLIHKGQQFIARLVPEQWDATFATLKRTFGLATMSALRKVVFNLTNAKPTSWRQTHCRGYRKCLPVTRTV